MLIEDQPPAIQDGTPAVAREGDDLAWLRAVIDRDEVPELGTIAEKVTWLRETLHPPGRPYAYEEIEERIKRGVTVAGRPVDPALQAYKASGRQIGNVASGATTNPSLTTLTTLAAFFHIDPAFFVRRRIGARELFAPARTLLGYPRTRTARTIATRLGELTTDDQRMVLDLVQRLARQRSAPREEP